METKSIEPTNKRMAEYQGRPDTGSRCSERDVQNVWTHDLNEQQQETKMCHDRNDVRKSNKMNTLWGMAECHRGLVSREHSYAEKSGIRPGGLQIKGKVCKCALDHLRA